MDNSAYYEVVKETVKQLNNIMNVSLSDRIKDAVKKALGRSVRTKDPLFWHAGMLMVGLVSALEYLEKVDDAKEIRDEIKASLEEHVDLWFRKTAGKVGFVDDALAGFALVRAYEITGNEKFREAADAVKTYIGNAGRDAEGAILYNSGRSGNIFVDGIGQVSMFMAACGDDSFDGNKQLRLFYKYGMDEESGLCYHGYELKKADNDDRIAADRNDSSKNGYVSDKKGILCWGRAFGWLIMGASVNAALGKADEESFSQFRSLCEAALKYQRADGGWSWQLQALDGHIDLSATGMIAYALGYAVNNDVFGEADLPDKIRAALKKAKECIYAHTKSGIVTDSLSSCDDFAVHYQTYGNYPWGQGAALAAFSVIN
ncbi:Rhamnogalacturonyl hydrolase YesR [Butyrivibrio hungatei]|uniref:Rhamnogalacturonyl hydrolase YesR n=1 Tax=Butyrivibrio hungatei TaxID=185008 RepID=A0A1G5CA76_9FIRM|nr:glycoside hydrolase family 88 protein [Butyrivibrio hungatei]SCX99218.1 Rhamnogalacturonyl hydrolase YesR [Butyrivibrio hungatei]